MGTISMNHPKIFFNLIGVVGMDNSTTPLSMFIALKIQLSLARVRFDSNVFMTITASTSFTI